MGGCVVHGFLSADALGRKPRSKVVGDGEVRLVDRGEGSRAAMQFPANGGCAASPRQRSSRKTLTVKQVPCLLKKREMTRQRDGMFVHWCPR